MALSLKGPFSALLLIAALVALVACILLLLAGRATLAGTSGLLFGVLAALSQADKIAELLSRIFSLSASAPARAPPRTFGRVGLSTFFGRRKEMFLLRWWLRRSKGGLVIAIQGDNGVGKTAIARALAGRMYQDGPYDYVGVIEFNPAGGTAGASGTSQLPDLALDLERYKERARAFVASQQELAEEITKGLQPFHRPLLILDNVSGPADVSLLRSKLPRADFVATSNNTKWGENADKLIRPRPRIGHRAGLNLLHKVGDLSADDAAARVGKLVSWHPNDLYLAARERAKHGVSWNEIETRVKSRLIIGKNPVSGAEEGYFIRLSKLRVDDPPAFNVLARAAMIGPRDLPRELLTNRPKAEGRFMGGTADLGLLADFGLLPYADNSREIAESVPEEQRRLHADTHMLIQDRQCRFIREFMVSKLDAPSCDALYQETLQVVNDAFEYNYYDPNTWESTLKLSPISLTVLSPPAPDWIERLPEALHEAVFDLARKTTARLVLSGDHDRTLPVILAWEKRVSAWAARATTRDHKLKLLLAKAELIHTRASALKARAKDALDSPSRDELINAESAQQEGATLLRETFGENDIRAISEARCVACAMRNAGRPAAAAFAQYESAVKHRPSQKPNSVPYRTRSSSIEETEAMTLGYDAFLHGILLFEADRNQASVAADSLRKALGYFEAGDRARAKGGAPIKSTHDAGITWYHLARTYDFQGMTAKAAEARIEAARILSEWPIQNHCSIVLSDVRRELRIE